jgi:fucose permease
MGIGGLIGLMSTKGFMLRNYIGKWLFPRLHPSQYAREFKIIAVTLSLGLISAGGLTTVLILRGTVGK